MAEVNTMKYLVSTAFALFALGNVSAAQAQTTEITLVAPGGIKTSIEQLLPGFESKTGYKVKAVYLPGIAIKKQITSGEATFDTSVLQAPYPEVLASGNIVAGTETPLVTNPVGIAVKKGAPKPDISTAAAVKKTLLAATSVSYPDPKGGATAGISFEEALKGLGISEQIQAKFKPARGGAGVMAMTAKGDAEIGATFLSEMEDPGIDIVGPLPREVSTPTALVGFMGSRAKDTIAAKALLDYLSSPSAAPVYKANRMQPGR
jgi:molybdate transport system substrate-binding protein